MILKCAKVDRVFPHRTPGPVNRGRVWLDTVCSQWLHWWIAASLVTMVSLRSPPIGAQQFPFTAYPPHDLPQVTARNIVQDEMGYLWIGTFADVARYDGVQFKAFGPGAGLVDGRINAMTQDSSGHIWVATHAGVARFAEGHFQTFGPEHGLGSPVVVNLISGPSGTIFAGTAEPASVSAISTPNGSAPPQIKALNIGSTEGISRITVLMHDDTGRLLIGTDGGGVRILDQAHNLTIIDEATGLPGSHISDLALTPDGILYIATNGGIARHSNGQIFSWGRAHGITAPADVRSLALSKDGSLYFSTASGQLWKIDSPAKRQPGRASLQAQGPSTAITQLRFDSRGLIWGATKTAGLIRFDPQRSTLNTINSKNGLASNSVHAIFEDHENTLWVGSAQGLFKLRNAAFINYLSKTGLPHNSVWAINRLGDTLDAPLLVGTEKGLGLMRKDGWDYLDKAEGLLDERVSCIAVTSPTRFYVGGNDRSAGGVTRVDITPTGYQFKRYGQAEGLLDGRIRTLARAPDGALLAGTGAGLMRLDNDRFGPVPLPDLPPTTGIFTIAVDKARTWVGTTHGLVVFEADQSRLLTTEDGLTSQSVLSLTTSPDNSVWIAYLNAVGATHLTLSSLNEAPTTTHLTIDNGLPSNAVRFVGSGTDGNAWFGSSRGASRYDGKQIRNYTQQDGLIWDDADTNAFFHDVDGTAWIGTSKGLSHFIPTYERPENVPAPIPTIQSVSLGRQTPPAGNTVEYSHRDFRAAFSALSYIDEGANSFRYRLKGYQDEWSDLAHSKQATFTNLPPGEYEFEVETRNPLGTLSIAPATFGFTILPPFYMTWWFRLLCSLGIIGLVAATYRARVAQLQHAAKRLEEIVEQRTHQLAEEKKVAEHERERAEDAHKKLSVAHKKVLENDRTKTEFFQNASHELRTPLTFIVGPVEALERGEHGEVSSGVSPVLATIRRNANRLWNLVNQILRLQTLGTNQRNLCFRPTALNTILSPIIEATTRLSTAAGNTLEYTESGSPRELYLDDDAFAEIMLNVLSNALKFMPEVGKITVQVNHEDALTTIEVSDTGIGIPAEHIPNLFHRFYRVGDARSAGHEGTGLGLSLVKDLIEIHGGGVSITSDVAKGTRVTLSFPTGKAHLHADNIDDVSSAAAQPEENASNVFLTRLKEMVVSTADGTATDSLGPGGRRPRNDLHQRHKTDDVATNLILRLRPETDGTIGPVISCQWANGKVSPVEPIGEGVQALWWGERRIPIEDMPFALTAQAAEDMLNTVRAVQGYERRAPLRIDGLRTQATMKYAGNTLEGHLLDVSAAACTFQPDNPDVGSVDIETNVELRFALGIGKRPMSLTGYVRSAPEDTYRIQFDFDEAIGPRINRYVIDHVHNLVTGRLTASGVALVVDDNSDLRPLVAHILRQAGLTVVLVGSSEEALTYLACSPMPTIMIVDWMMPGMSGPELTARLRTEWGMIHVPILLLTAAGYELAAKGLSSGADDYLVKPFQEDELLARVRTLLVRELRRKNQE